MAFVKYFADNVHNNLTVLPKNFIKNVGECMKKILIIWDFDGVIADSEHLWIKSWVQALKKLKGIELNNEQQEYYLKGKAEKDIFALLKQDFPNIEFAEDFQKALHADDFYLMQNEMKMTCGIENILADNNFRHCIATGATTAENNLKLQILHLEKYFPPETRFTIDQVKFGKPAPDLFLFAAAKMKYPPNNSVVIEDSPAGITAAKAAGMRVIAYIGASGNHNERYAELCRKSGADHIIDNMPKIHNLLNNL